MAPLPVVTPRKLIRALEHLGFFIHHVRGSHYFLKHPGDPTRRTTIAYHSRSLKRGTLRAILKQADVTVEQLMELL